MVPWKVSHKSNEATTIGMRGESYIYESSGLHCIILGTSLFGSEDNTISIYMIFARCLMHSPPL